MEAGYLNAEEGREGGNWMGVLHIAIPRSYLGAQEMH